MFLEEVGSWGAGEHGRWRLLSYIYIYNFFFFQVSLQGTLTNFKCLVLSSLLYEINFSTDIYYLC